MLRHLIICLVLIMAGCDERRDNFFVDYNQAKKDGELARGWIPEGVPYTATSIRETHYVDDETVWLSYRYTGETSFTCSGKLVAVQLADIKGAVSGGPGWWEDKVTDFLESAAASYGNQYICQGRGDRGMRSQHGILLINYSTREVLYTTTFGAGNGGSGK